MLLQPLILGNENTHGRSIWSFICEYHYIEEENDSHRNAFFFNIISQFDFIEAHQTN